MRGHVPPGAGMEVTDNNGFDPMGGVLWSRTS